MDVEGKLRSLGLELPDPLPPIGNYVGAVRAGNLLFLSGHGPRRRCRRHARLAVGMNSLPMNIPVEIELVLEIDSHAPPP